MYLLGFCLRNKKNVFVYKLTQDLKKIMIKFKKGYTYKYMLKLFSL